MAMSMVVTVTVAVAVIMAVMMMAKSCHTNKVYCQTQAADNEQLGEPLSFPAFENPFKSFYHDFHANEPVHDVRIFSSTYLSRKDNTYTKNTPFAKPLRVSTLPKP